MGRSNSSRETKFSGAIEDKKMFVFLVQLTTSRIGNLTHTYLHKTTSKQSMAWAGDSPKSEQTHNSVQLYDFRKKDMPFSLARDLFLLFDNHNRRVEQDRGLPVLLY